MIVYMYVLCSHVTPGVTWVFSLTYSVDELYLCTAPSLVTKTSSSFPLESNLLL